MPRDTLKGCIKGDDEQKDIKWICHKNAWHKQCLFTKAENTYPAIINTTAINATLRWEQDPKIGYRHFITSYSESAQCHIISYGIILYLKCCWFKCLEQYKPKKCPTDWLQRPILVKQKNEIDIPCSRPLSIPAPDKEKR